MEEPIQEQFNEEQEDRYQREETTFWSDFSIAEHFGTAAIEDTYNRAMEGTLQVFDRTCTGS